MNLGFLLKIARFLVGGPRQKCCTDLTNLKLGCNALKMAA